MPKTRLVSWFAALAVLVAAFAVAGCGGGSGEASSGRPGERIAGIEERQLRVTTTANFITDLAGQIGGERVEVTGLMGPGVDPHLYKASAGDVDRLGHADVIFYGGLELEGRMSDLLIEIAAE